MSERDPHRWSRFAASAVALVALVVVVPVGLIAASRARFGSANPLAGADPPWRWGSNEVGDALSGPLADDTVIDGIIRLSLCVVWVAVAVIVVTTVVEVIHAVRHHGLAFPDVRGAGWAQPIARYIAVGLVAVLPMMTSATSLASTLGTRAAPTASFGETVGAVEAPAITATSDVATVRSPSAPSPAGGAVHVVTAGESIYSIAVSLAGGDSGRVLEIADAIIDANLGTVMPGGQRFTNPAYVEVGWTLQLPAEIAGSQPAQSDTGREVDAHGEDASVATYTVERGDTLWDIADEQLGDPTAWPEIWERNAGDDMGGGRSFDDPDLILPGWELELAEVAPADASGETTVEDVRPTPTDLPVIDPAAPTTNVTPVDTAPTTSIDEIARRGTTPAHPRHTQLDSSPVDHDHHHGPATRRPRERSRRERARGRAGTRGPVADPDRTCRPAGCRCVGARRGAAPPAPACGHAASPGAGAARGHRPHRTHPAHDRCRRTGVARRRRVSGGGSDVDRHRQPDRLGRDLIRR